MSRLAIIIVIFFSIFFSQACNFLRKNQDVDPFYTTRSFGDIPQIPLVKPLALSYDRVPNTWYLIVPWSFKQKMMIDSIKEIGVEKSFVFGKIFERQHYEDQYSQGDYMFVSKFNVIYGPTKPRKTREDEIQIYPVDSTNKLFILPERWYVLNTADSTLEAFFSQDNYENHLKEKGIAGKMYNIDSVEKDFVKTGIAPWFPDSVKTKLRD